VTGDFIVAVDEAHDLVVGDHGQRAPSIRGWDGVAIRVELHEGGLVDGDRDDGVCFGKRIGE